MFPSVQGVSDYSSHKPLIFSSCHPHMKLNAHTVECLMFANLQVRNLGTSDVRGL